MLSAVVLLAVVLLPAVGCSDSTPITGPDLTQPVGKLPRLKYTRNEDLRAMLADLADAELLPDQISQTVIAPESNAAPALEAIIPAPSRESAFTRTELFFPQVTWSLTPTGKEQALHYLELNDAKRVAARNALSGRDCRFRIDHTEALTADLSFVYLLRTMARLEALHADGHLREGRPADCLPAIEMMFRYARILDEHTHITCRLQAVHARGDALLILEAVCQHANATPAVMQAAKELASRQLENWPDEAKAWQSDRVMGLICFEHARAGGLTTVLTIDEIDALTPEQQENVDDRTDAQIDADAFAYLKAMDSVVAECESPLFERDGIALAKPSPDPDQSSDPTSEVQTPPFSLAELLIEDVPGGQSLFAWDRARMEAWEIALSAACDELFELSDKTSPLSGQPYAMLKREETIAVWGIGPVDSEWDRPVVVRRMR